MFPTLERLFTRTSRPSFLARLDVFQLLGCVLIIVLHLILLSTRVLERAEYAVLGQFLRQRPSLAVHPDLALIEIDDETLQAIEFANLQLLEYRHIDNRLDDNLATAYSLVRPPGGRGRWLHSWRMHGQSLRLLGELRVEATGLFERTSNVLKLVGDQYLARLYRMLALRFHLPQWEQNIQRKLEVLERTYQMLSDQGATLRAEGLELTIIALIALEIVLAFWRH